MYLVTGATGFVGTSVCALLQERGLPYRGGVRANAGPHQIAIGDIGSHTSWWDALAGVDTVIHLASRVHRAKSDEWGAMHEVNVAGSRRLTEEAVRAGVRRLVYVSSIKVNGDLTGSLGFPEYFTEDDAPNPRGAYAVTKLEAEQVIREVAADTQLQVTVVRPPLVYGPGVGANFARLTRLVQRGIPLPFASVTNERSLVSARNLADFLLICAKHPRAAGRTFLVADGEDMSTPTLISHIAEALGVEPRLVKVPVSILEGVATMLGREDQLYRLTRSLRIDCSVAREVLDWIPPTTVRDGIKEAVGP